MRSRGALSTIALAAVAACTCALGAACRSPEAAPSPPLPVVTSTAASASASADGALPFASCPPTIDPRLPSAMREDIDGDGKPDWIIRGSREVAVFVDRSGCPENRGGFVTEGSLAFVHVDASSAAAAGKMRDLRVDTWLHHGDRAQYVYAWTGSAWVMKSRGRDIIEGTPP